MPVNNTESVERRPHIHFSSQFYKLELIKHLADIKIKFV